MSYTYKYVHVIQLNKNVAKDRRNALLNIWCPVMSSRGTAGKFDSLI